MTKSRPWIRLYTDLPSNPKAQRLPGNLFKFWINCLCLYGKKGYFPPANDVAWALQMTEKATIKCLQSLITAGLLEESPGDKGFEGILVDALVPHDWGDLQFESDNSRERQREYRARHAKRYGDVVSDVTVTAQEQNRADTEQIQSRTEEPDMTPALDEQFQEYRRLFEIVGNPIPEDFANGSFCWRAWCKLDYTQRATAIESLAERERAGATVLNHPDTYLTKGAYQRKLLARANGNGKRDIAAEMLAELREKNG